MTHKPVLHLEVLNVKYDGDKSAEHVYRALVPGGWLIFIWTPGHGGLSSATFYPDPSHVWDGGTQQA
jgi:hypothetical protein